MGWAALSELVPLYPLYALLFLDTGLSDAQISMLFAVWSVTSFVTEVPAGALADRWSRRGVVVLAGVLQAAGFVVWTAAPEAWAFAVGFVIWGVSGALVSGASEALVYDGLAAVGAGGSYARVNGWMTSAELLVQVPTAFAAERAVRRRRVPAGRLGERRRCLAAAALALRFPEAPGRRTTVRTAPSARASASRCAPRRCGVLVLAVALLGGLDAVEEYFPVLAGDWGVPTTAVPFAVLVIALAGAAGAALGGRADRLRGGTLLGLLVVAAGCLAVAAVVGPAGGAGRRRGLLRPVPRGARRRRGAAAGRGSPARTGRRSPRSRAWASSWPRCWCSPPGRSAGRWRCRARPGRRPGRPRGAAHQGAV